MPLAKTAKVVQEQEKSITEHPEPTFITDTGEKIGAEFYRYFNVNPLTSSQELEYIYSWARNNTKSIGDAFKKLSSLETKLGAPKVGETRLQKIYNYLRLNDKVKATSLNLRNRIEGIQSRYRLKLAEIRNNYKERVGKTNEAISRIDSEYKNFLKSTKTKMNMEIERIKKEYENQLSELKAIRDAYGG